MVNVELLAMTGMNALSICVYGGPGLRKTQGIHTLPPPVEMHCLEDTINSLLPWVRRVRHCQAKQWSLIGDDIRQRAYESVPESKRLTNVKAGPLVDVVKYDPLDPQVHEKLLVNVSGFRKDLYSSIAIDSLQELSVEEQTFAKAGKGIAATEPMVLNLWPAVQERTAIMLRRLRTYRGEGIFVYFTGSEDIEKDYVQDPRELPAGVKADQPFNIRGSVNVPGKMTALVQHVTNIMAHARMMNGQPRWVVKSEPIGVGGAHWDAKDDTGRLPDYNEPNIRKMMDVIYGEQTRRDIYQSGIEAASKSS